MHIKIRQETTADFYSVYKLNKLAFGQPNEAELVDLLRKSDAFIPELSLVAITNEAVIGHILFTKISIKSDTGDNFESLALAPMAVHPNWQGQDIGGQLIRSGLQKAKELGYKSVIVLGHANYYPKFGFESAEKWNIHPPFDVPSTVFMAIELVENGLAGVTGTVEYPKEFDMV